MLSAECMDLITDAEASFPVDRWRVGGFYVWPLVRARLYWELHDSYRDIREDSRGGGRASRAGGLVGSYAGHLRSRVRDRRHEASLREQADVIVLGDNVSRIWVDGAWYDRLCEPIIEGFDELGLRCLHLEPNHLYRAPRHNRSAHIQVALDRAKALNQVQSPRRLSIEMEGYGDFLAWLGAHDGAVESVERRNIISVAAFVGRASALFGAVMETSLPTRAVVVDYSPVSMAFNLACRRRGIPSIELQHGVQGDQHWAYGRWTKLPQDGYELLPSVYWTWSEFEAKTIERWASTRPQWHMAIIGGNPWLNRWLDGADPMVRKYDELVAAHTDASRNTPVVLLALQTGVAGPGHLAAILGAVRATRDRWRWWPRLHPAMVPAERRRSQQLLEAAGFQRGEIDRVSELPLYSLMRATDLHVTVSSSTVLEAHSFGVPSVVTDHRAVDAYPTQAESGWMTYASDPEEVIRAGSQLMEWARHQPKPRTADRAVADVLRSIR